MADQLAKILNMSALPNVKGYKSSRMNGRRLGVESYVGLQPRREILFMPWMSPRGAGRRHYRGSLKYQRWPSGSSTV